MVFITNPFLLPFLLVIWSAEAWVFLASIKLILDKIPSMQNNRIRQSLGPFTDSLPKLTTRCIQRLTNKSTPDWAAWLITFAAVIFLRHILILFVMAVQSA